MLYAVLLCSCADYKIDKATQDKSYYTSTGFALVYEDSLYEQKTINKKIDNETLEVMHSSLKKNTPIKIINLEKFNFRVFKFNIIYLHNSNINRNWITNTIYHR